MLLYIISLSLTETVIDSLRHRDKDSHRFCDIMSVLDVEELFQCFVRQELCYLFLQPHHVPG